MVSTVDIETGGHRGTCPPHFSKTRAKCPYLCSFVALLENFENARNSRKYAFLTISEDRSFKISRGEPAPDPLSGLHCFTPQTKGSISPPETLPRCPSFYGPPHLYNAFYVSGLPTVEEILGTPMNVFNNRFERR